MPSPVADLREWIALLEREGELVRVRAEVKMKGQTGVEMEALTAVSVACLTIYDMAKAIDRGMVIGEVRLVEKRGGKSGVWRLASGRGRLTPVSE